MACGSPYKNIFGLLIFMSIGCVIFQYRFNFSSISQCLANQKRFVATRVVERVYFEMPNAPSTATPSQVTDGFFSSIPNQEASTSTAVPLSTPVEKEPSTELPLQAAISPATESIAQNTCTPSQYVLFLKTHKTGSSTLTNILNRYADWHNLTMLLPKDDDYYSFDWPNKFRLNFAKNTYGRRPHILANHARYSRKSMNVLFPREDTFYVTVLRHPVKQWESTFNYMSFPYILNILKTGDPLDFFLKNPPSYENIIEIGRRYPSLYLIKNPQFFDLGFDYKYYDNKTMIRRAIRTLEKDFNLVLLMEYFDESLTLLKRRLCWDIDDVVYFKMNERLNKNKRKKLTREQKRKIYQWNNADVALYDYFSKLFWQEVEKEGPDFYVDLAALRNRKDYYFKTCIEKEAIEEAYTAVFVKGFAMRRNLTGNTKIFCERMLRNELNYQDIYKKRHNKWTKALAGVTIENFDEITEEADVSITESMPTGIDGQGYRYVRPTKKPHTTAAPKTTSAKGRSEESDGTNAKRKRSKNTNKRVRTKSAKSVETRSVSDDERHDASLVSGEGRISASGSVTVLSNTDSSTESSTEPYKEDKEDTVNEDASVYDDNKEEQGFIDNRPSNDIHNSKRHTFVRNAATGKSTAQQVVSQSNNFESSNSRIAYTSQVGNSDTFKYDGKTISRSHTNN